MGYEIREIRIVGHLSRHNSDRDREDDQLWESLADEIREIVRSARYDQLGLDVM